MAKTKINENSALAINLIANGTTLKGDIHTDSDFRIDGVLQGTIHSKSKVIVGETGKVEGEINCENADVSGSINGTMNIQGLLSMKSSASIEGEVVTAKVSIEEGAVFAANCRMEKGATSNETKSKRIR